MTVVTGTPGPSHSAIIQGTAVRHVFLFYLACAGALAASGEVTCPESVKVTETAALAPGWKASSGQSEHAFERISVYNGAAGGKEYELAPDDEKNSAGKIIQTWKLKDYRTMNLFLRCRYHDTAAVLFMDLPANLTTCTFTFTLDKKGNFLGKSSMICR